MLFRSPLSGESFKRRTTCRDPEARLDIRARGFWGNRFDCAMFDVRVFNPHAQSNRNPGLASVYQRHERQKKAIYEERVCEVERATFTPLVFSTTGGAGRLATTFLRHLASLLAAQHDEPYSIVMSWLRSQIGFSLLRSSIMCLRGSRGPSANRIDHSSAPSLVVSQARVLA